MVGPKPSSDSFLRDLIGGRYRRVRLIGRGSHGTVWECEDICTSLRVACKSIPHVPRDSTHPQAPVRVDDICTEVCALKKVGGHINIVGLIESTGALPSRGKDASAAPASPTAKFGATSLPASPTKSNLRSAASPSSADFRASPSSPAPPFSNATIAPPSPPASPCTPPSPLRNKSPRPYKSASALGGSSACGANDGARLGGSFGANRSASLGGSSPLGEDYVGAERQIVGVKLADFGVSAILKGGMRELRRSRGAGTPAYMAPEMGWQKRGGGRGKAVGETGEQENAGGMGLNGRVNNPTSSDLPEYGVKADVWSLGVTLCTILTARIPSHPVDFSKPEWEGVSADAKDLVRRMLVVDPDQRLSSFEVLEHPWLNQTAVRSLDPAVRCPHLLSPSLPGETSGNQVTRIVCM
ncbi:unnamed protein product [Closterium sp. Yama58-4]|nr:unnamed protein product [Closterium sp. Yama58-4]